MFLQETYRSKRFFFNEKKRFSLDFEQKKNRINTAGSSLVGTAATFIQNLPNIPSMLREGETLAKLNETEIARSCSILCTAEYCVETVQQVRR